MNAVFLLPLFSRYTKDTRWNLFVNWNDWQPLLFIQATMHSNRTLPLFTDIGSKKRRTDELACRSVVYLHYS